MTDPAPTQRPPRSGTPKVATRLEEVTADRDRLRAALERVESHGSGEAVRIAREALAHAA